MPPGSKRGRRVARKRNRSNPLIKPGDMLTKSIHEYFRKTVSAECSFFHRRSKLASRNGLSFLIGLLELLKKSASALFLRKSDSYPSSERRSGGWWIVFSAPGYRAAEAQESASDFLSEVTNREIRIGSFRESYFPSEWPAIK